MKARGRPLSPATALLLEAALSLALAFLPALLLLANAEGALLGLAAILPYYLSPVYAAALAFYGARRGAAAICAALLPVAGVLLAWLCLRLTPPALPCALMLVTGVIGAVAGQEARRRAEKSPQSRPKGRLKGRKK